MTTPYHLSTEELDAGLTHVRRSPQTVGVLEMIVRRPAPGEREVLEVGELSLVEGLVGDDWATRGSALTPDGSAHPDKQLNLMNSRVIALVAGERARWHLAGDQLFIDLDLSPTNLPPGSRLSIGGAIIEITPSPHTGCQKFIDRYGLEAMRWVNSPLGKTMRLRGACARVIVPGTIRRGDPVRKLDRPEPAGDDPAPPAG